MQDNHTEGKSSDRTAASRFAKYVDLAGKVLLSGAIVFGVLFCLSIVMEWRASPAPPVRSSEKASSNAAATDMREMLAGNWVFADMPWSLQVLELTREEAIKALERAEPDLVPLKSTNQGTVDLGLIADMFLAANAQQSTSNNIRYAIQTEELRAVAYAPLQSPQEVQIAKVMQAVGTGRWNYIEIKTQPNIAGQGDDDHVSLLPMPAGVRRMAVRLSDTNRVCGELYELSSPLQELHQLWRGDGWNLRQLSSLVEDKTSKPTNDVASATDELEYSQAIACTRNSDLIIVVPPLAGSDSAEFLLILQPAK